MHCFLCIIKSSPVKCEKYTTMHLVAKKSDGEEGDGDGLKLVNRLDFEIHPLDNPYFLGDVFQHLSVAELKACRAVGSKIWLAESQKVWRDKATLKISGMDHIPEQTDAGDGVTVDEMLEMYTNENDPLQLESRPFANYKFIALDEYRPYHNWVMHKFSRRIKSLTLMNCKFLSFKSFLDLILLKLPNLERLKLKGELIFENSIVFKNNSGGYEVHPKLKCLELETTKTLIFPETPFPWKLFFSKLVKLEDLQMRLEYRDTLREQWQVLQYLNPLRDNPNIKNLEVYPVNVEKKIYCHQEKYVDILNVIPKCFLRYHVPLERFTGSANLISSITQFGENLQFLRLRVLGTMHCCMPNGLQEEDYLEFTATFPEMKELQFIGQLSPIFKNLGRCEFPKLQRLTMEPPDDLSKRKLSRQTEDLTEPIGQFIYPNIRELECHHLNCILRKREIAEVARVMPNVSMLVMPLTSKTFPEVCRRWPKLRSITILESERVNSEGKGVNDKAITGISKRLKSVKKTTERSPNITDLKELYEITIHCDRERGKSRLTEFSVTHGFLLCPNLRKLEVTVAQISGKNMKSLEEKLLVAKVHTKPMSSELNIEESDSDGSECEDFYYSEEEDEDDESQSSDGYESSSSSDVDNDFLHNHD